MGWSRVEAGGQRAQTHVMELHAGELVAARGCLPERHDWNVVSTSSHTSKHRENY